MEEQKKPGILKLDSKEFGGSDRNVQWDEAVIAEHDKERGTRMVIDEPKTPFVFPVHPGEEAEQRAGSFALPEGGEDINAKTPADVVLKSHQPAEVVGFGSSKVEEGVCITPQGSFEASKRGEQHVNGITTSPSAAAAFIDGLREAVTKSDKQDEDEAQRKADFEARRKLHYNEFFAVKKLQLDETDDEE